MKIPSIYKTFIRLDNEEGGTEEVPLHVKRLTEVEYVAFETGMKRLNDPPSNRLLGGRKPDEMERDLKDNFILTDSSMVKRRIAELEGAALADYEAADEEDERWTRVFLQDAIERFITVPEGALEGPEGEDVMEGAQLVRLYRARADVLKQLIMAVWNENTMSADVKKLYRSLSASQLISNELPKDPAGLRPETPAPVASPEGSALAAVVMGETESTPSGSAEVT